MADFEGGSVEPLVGEVRVLRSFALADDGSLLPITEAGGQQPWVDGENIATCTLGGDHPSPHEGCACGFYAYGDPAWIDPDLYGWFRHVVGTVECYGKVIAGEKGIKAQKARIVAVWLSAEVPLPISDKARKRYPGVEFFTDRNAMEQSYPATRLDTYRRTPNPAMRLVGSWVRWTPLVGVVAGAGLGYGMGGSNETVLAWLTLLLIPALWVIYLPVRWGMAQGLRALRAVETMVLAFFFATAVAFALVSETRADDPASAVVLAVCLVVAGVVMMTLRHQRLSRGARDFEPVVRSGPLERLVGQGITSLKQVAEPHVYHLAWVHVLSSPRGDIALIQSLNQVINTAEMLPAHEGWMKERGIQGALFVGSKPQVSVADRTGANYTLSAPLPLHEVFEALGVPSRVWCPWELRRRWVTETIVGEEPSSIVATGVVPVEDVFPPDEMPMADSPHAMDAYAHGQALAGRVWYQKVQAEIARAGVEPIARPSLPPLVPEVDERVLVEGWRRLLRLPGPDASSVQRLYLAVLKELPEAAVVEERTNLLDQQGEVVRQALHDGGWTSTPFLAAHLVTALLDQQDIIPPECFVRADEIATLYPQPHNSLCRLTVWALPGAAPA